jgi:hypothetical protein
VFVLHLVMEEVNNIVEQNIGDHPKKATHCMCHLGNEPLWLEFWAHKLTSSVILSSLFVLAFGFTLEFKAKCDDWGIGAQVLQACIAYTDRKDAHIREQDLFCGQSS